MADTHFSNKSQHDGNIPFLPVGSVRSVITINPPISNTASTPSLPSRETHGKNRRRGLPIGLARINNASPSVAMSSFYTDKLDGGESQEGKEYGSSERISMVATCIPPSTRAGADADAHDERNISRMGRISLATIIDSPLESGRRGYRVTDMQYSSKNSSFSSVCIATISDANSSNQPYSLLLATDTTSGRINTCRILHKPRGLECKKGNQLLDMQECHFDVSQTPNRGKKAKSTKKSTLDSSLPQLGTMNTLTARLECATLTTTAISTHGLLNCTPNQKLPTKSTSSSSKRKGRKRKHSPTKDDAASKNISVDTTTKAERIHLVASNLNEPTLASQLPPSVLILSAGTTTDASSSEPDSIKNCQWTCQAWSKIPGLEHVDVSMSCILFASRSACGPMIWDGIVSAIRSNKDTEALLPVYSDTNERDIGLVLMGFQDGSLRASLVVCTSNDVAITNDSIDISKATTVLQLSANEPFISIQLLRTPSGVTRSFASGPTLVCVGALGTVVALSSSSSSERGNKKHDETPKFTIEPSLKPCGGRWITMACVGYRFIDKTRDAAQSLDSIPSIVLSFVGVNDSRRTFLHHVSLSRKQQSGSKVYDDSGHSIGCGQSIHRLPIPASISYSTHALPEPMFASDGHSPMHVTFTVSALSGKTVVIRMPLMEKIPTNQALSSMELPRSSGGVTSLLSKLKCEGSSALRDANSFETISSEKIDSQRKSKLSKLQSLLQSATTKQNRNETNLLLGSINYQSNHATKEIREATRIAAFVNKPGSMSSPMQIISLTNQKPGTLECVIDAEKLPLTRQSASTWLPSVHILQSCRHALSTLLRPESIEAMTTICYRRTLRGVNRPTLVVYGGTATSYSVPDFDGDVKGSLGRTIKVDVPLINFIPASTYASWSMVYHHIHDDGWCRSDVCWQPRRGIKNKAAQSEVLHLTGSSKRSCIGDGRFLGVSLPFDTGAKTNNASSLMFDILTCTSSDNHAFNIGEETKSRDIAERNVLQWYQNRSSQTDSQKEYVLPLFKEQQWIRHHSGSFAKFDGTTDTTVYCCSSSMRCTSIECVIPTLVNLGVGTIAIVLPPNEMESGITGDVGFAVGSDIITSSESMSLLPLIRQAIVRRSLEYKGHTQMIWSSKQYLQQHQLYHDLLSQKQTTKIAKYIDKSSEELLANMDKTLNDTYKHLCPNDLLAASISLYETMRMINFAF